MCGGTWTWRGLTEKAKTNDCSDTCWYIEWTTRVDLPCATPAACRGTSEGPLMQTAPANASGSWSAVARSSHQPPVEIVKIHPARVVLSYHVGPTVDSVCSITDILREVKRVPSLHSNRRHQKKVRGGALAPLVAMPMWLMTLQFICFVTI